MRNIADKNQTRPSWLAVLLLGFSALGTPAGTTLADDSRQVTRAQFATGISSREPVDAISALDTSHSSVMFFTELSGLAGHTIRHRWEYNGQVMGEVSFRVDGTRWRVWSSKQLLPHWTGQWTASVVDDTGQTLAIRTLEYTTVAPAPGAN